MQLTILEIISEPSRSCLGFTFDFKSYSTSLGPRIANNSLKSVVLMATGLSYEFEITIANS